MAENINENGLSPDGIDAGQYKVKSPAVKESEYSSVSDISSIKSLAVAESEYSSLDRKFAVDSAGVVLGEEVGKDRVMFI